MSCFETRKQFANFWRKRLDRGQAVLITDHLRECSSCDHSFRAFALTAPVLHSAFGGYDASAHRGIAGSAIYKLRTVRESNRHAPQAGKWTAIAMVLAASMVAYVATTVPNPSLTEVLTSPQPVSTLSSVQDSAFPLDDFAG
ncbi:MAG: hypothetical protein IVW54_14990 [Candidatus Binataceae bacterium]|nr:hypothetical protein [Candidatus Binataceae bacterium]